MCQDADELRCLQCGESYWIRLLLMAERLVDAVILQWALDQGYTVPGCKQVQRPRAKVPHGHRRREVAAA